MIVINTALFAGAFLYCLFFINEGLFHADSVILAKAVEDVYRTGHLHPAANGRYGIVIINSVLYFPFYLLGRNADFLTRFSSVLFYALSIPVFFHFINDLFRDRIQGFIAAVLLALTPFYLVPNTYGKEHGMSMFFFLCSMVLVNRGGGSKCPTTLAWASVCYMVSLSVRESVLFMFPFYLWLYFKPAVTFRPFGINIPKERLNSRLLISLTLPLVVFFSIMMIVYLAPLIQRSISSDSFSVPHFYGFFSKLLSFAFMDLGRSFPAYFFLFGVTGAVIAWRSRQNFLPVFFLVWAGMIFIYGNLDSYTARYLDMPVLAVLAFVSFFLAWLYRRYRIWAVIIFALLIAVQLARVYPMLEFRRHYNGALRLAVFAGSISPPNAVFIAVDEAPFIEYYGKRKTMSYPVGHWERFDDFLLKIESLLDRNVPVYVIPTSSDYLSDRYIRKISDRFKIISVGKVLVEDYHSPELDLKPYMMTVSKLKRVKAGTGR